MPTRVYDETIASLQSAVEKARLGNTDKAEAIKKLTSLAQKAEKNFLPNQDLEALLKKENKDAWKYGGRTTNGFVKPPEEP